MSAMVTPPPPPAQANAEKTYRRESTGNSAVEAHVSAAATNAT